MTQFGYWRNINQDNRNVITQSGGLGVLGKVHYVFPNGYGPYGSVVDLTNGVFPTLRSRDIIVIGGVLREQAVAPLNVYDVLVVGAANLPRQATSGGVPTGGGACWLAPTSAVASTPLIELKAQGWSFQNIEFTPYTGSAAIRLTRSASVDTTDAGHAQVEGCYFASNGGETQIGIEDNGGCRSVFVKGCRFEGLTSAILSLSTAAAVCQDWEIDENGFRGNTNDVKMSLNFSKIRRNVFMTAGSGATNKVISTTFIGAQGGGNFVIDNQFNNTEAEIAPGSGFTGAATDLWRNFVTDGTWYAIGQPA